MTLSRDIARCFDPVLLARACGIEPDPWQADLLREQPHRALLCCSRQSGKTTTALLLALWLGLYDTALILIVSPSLRQSGEAFRSLMALYHKLDGAPELKAESALRAEFAHGSRVVSLPGSERTIRGYSGADMIILDEAARIEPDLIQALTPMLAVKNGSMIALSTPFGRQGWFAETWHDETQDWKRVRVPASECPRLSKEFLDSELKALGGLAFSEEYDLAFNDSQLAMFPSALIERAFSDPTVRPLWA